MAAAKATNINHRNRMPLSSSIKFTVQSLDWGELALSINSMRAIIPVKF